MPLADYAAPALLVSYATLLAQAHRQEDLSSVFSRRHRHRSTNGSRASKALKSSLIGSRIDQIVSLGAAGAGDAETKKKQEKEQSRKARHNKVQAALEAVSAALWPRSFAREILRLPYEQREELSIALRRYLPNGHEVLSTMANPHGVLWEIPY